MTWGPLLLGTERSGTVRSLILTMRRVNIRRRVGPIGPLAVPDEEDRWHASPHRDAGSHPGQRGAPVPGARRPGGGDPADHRRVRLRQEAPVPRVRQQGRARRRLSRALPAGVDRDHGGGDPPYAGDPARQLVAMVHAVARQVAAPDYPGCPFRTTHAQFPDEPIPPTRWPSGTSRTCGPGCAASPNEPGREIRVAWPTGSCSSSTASTSTAPCSAGPARSTRQSRCPRNWSGRRSNQGTGQAARRRDAHRHVVGRDRSTPGGCPRRTPFPTRRVPAWCVMRPIGVGLS